MHYYSIRLHQMRLVHTIGLTLVDPSITVAHHWIPLGRVRTIIQKQERNEPMQGLI